MLKSLAVLAVAFAATSAAAQDSTIQQSMPFNDCLESVGQASAGLTQSPTITVDTPEKREVVMTVPDGKVTVTCDAATQQATMTHSR